MNYLPTRGGPQLLSDRFVGLLQDSCVPLQVHPLHHLEHHHHHHLEHHHHHLQHHHHLYLRIRSQVRHLASFFLVQVEKR